MQVRKQQLELAMDLLQYSCLGNAMDSRAWRATVHGVAKSLQIATAHCHFTEEEAAWGI